MPEPSLSPSPKKPVKVIKEKRRGSDVTLILHLSLDASELKKICSTLKQRFGCGGSVKEEIIELQGDQVANCKAFLAQKSVIS